MSTFNVVRENFELGLCIDGSLVRQKKRLVRLESVGFLRVSANQDLAVENRVGFAAEDALS